MTSLILLGILLTTGLTVPDGVGAAPSLGYNDARGDLLDALKFIEMKAIEEDQRKEKLYDNYEEEYEDYDNYIRDNWPDETPEIQLQPGPPIEEPPYYTDDWPEVEKLPVGSAFPAEYSQSEIDNDIEDDLQEESELESEEELELSEISEATFEDILKDMMRDELLKEYEDAEEDMDDEQSIESEEEEDVIVEESVLEEGEDEDGNEDEVMADEEAAILDRLTEEIAAEVEDEVADEIDKLTKETVKELAEEIAEEILEEMENGELEPVEDSVFEESVAEEDGDEDGLTEYLDQLEEMEEEAAQGDGGNQEAEKRDGEYPFGAWEDETNDEGFQNEVGNDDGEGLAMDSEGENEESDEVDWEALQYLYGPYLEELKQEYLEKGGGDESEEEAFDENLDSFGAEDEDEEARYPEYEDESEEIEEEVYDYSEDEDEALNEVLYEEIVEEAIKELEDEAAEAAKELVDEMLVELVEEEQKKEMLEQQRMQQYEQDQRLECSLLDYMVDDCQVVELYEGLGDGGYKEAFTGPCNRHQLCYSCASVYGVSARTCDEIYLNEMFDVCDAVSGSGSCEVHAGYFLKAAKNSRQIPEPSPYLDYVCRSECVYTALLQ